MNPIKIHTESKEVIKSLTATVVYIGCNNCDLRWSAQDKSLCSAA